MGMHSPCMGMHGVTVRECSLLQMLSYYPYIETSKYHLSEVQKRHNAPFYSSEFLPKIFSPREFFEVWTSKHRKKLNVSFTQSKKNSNF